MEGIKIICEMCGSDGNMFKAEIEGTILTVCRDCAKFGKVKSEVKYVSEKKKEEKIIEKPIAPKKELIFIVVEDFAEKVKKKRESMGLTQEDFAKMLNERVSLIHHIETGTLTPSIDLARKLEKLLHIMLVEQHEEAHGGSRKVESEGFTIGDFIKIKK